MECFEDVISKYYKSSLSKLFPPISKIPKKIFFYIISITHIIGVWYLFLGMLITPYKYIYVYIFYLITIIILYFILNDKCFMTDFFNSNYKAGDDEDSVLCDQNKLTHLRMKTIYKILCFLLTISFISLLIPNSYPQTIITNLIGYFKNQHNEIINYLPIIMLYFWILLYLFVKLTKLT